MYIGPATWVKTLSRLFGQWCGVLKRLNVLYCFSEGLAFGLSPLRSHLSCSSSPFLRRDRARSSGVLTACNPASASRLRRVGLVHLLYGRLSSVRTRCSSLSLATRHPRFWWSKCETRCGRFRQRPMTRMYRGLSTRRTRLEPDGGGGEDPAKADLVEYAAAES